MQKILEVLENESDSLQMFKMIDNFINFDRKSIIKYVPITILNNNK